MCSLIRFIFYTTQSSYFNVSGEKIVKKCLKYKKLKVDANAKNI